MRAESLLIPGESLFVAGVLPVLPGAFLVIRNPKPGHLRRLASTCMHVFEMRPGHVLSSATFAQQFSEPRVILVEVTHNPAAPVI